MGMNAKEFAQAARTLRRSPGFAVTAIITIALGIGATTAIFSVVNAVLLRPLPYADPERLVLVWGDMHTRDVTDFPFPPADFADLRQETEVFQEIGAVTTGRQPLSGDDGEPEQIRFAGATANIFQLLGARVILGRDFNESDATPNAPPQQPQGGQGGAAQGPPPIPASIILGNEFWQRRYGADPSVVGRTLNVGGQQGIVIGVLEPGVELLFPPGTNVERRPDVWTALRVDFAGGSRINVFLRVIGRLNPGVSLAQAQGAMDRLATDLRAEFPIKETSGLHIRVEPMQKDLTDDVRPALLALMGAVTFVLLIACANVANLLLVRVTRRERELAVRAALGGSHLTLARQMLIESMLLAAVGALLGLGLAWAGVRVLLNLAPDTLPRVDAVALDPVVLTFAVLAAFISAIAFGIIPAVRSARPDLMQVLRSSGRTSGLGGGAFLRNGVVVAEVALSFILLVGCGLMLRSFIAIQSASPGFNPDNALTFVVQNPRLQQPDARRDFMQQLQQRFIAIPGVEDATAVFPLPFDGLVANLRWGTEAAATDASAFQQAQLHIVLPGYFEAMGTRVIAGRTYTEADNRPDVNLVVIDRLVAAKAFPGESPIGKRLFIRVRTNEPEWYEVIGVVDHQRNISPAEDSREAMFFADGYFFHGAAQRWVIRASGDPSRVTAAVRSELAEVDPLIPMADVRTMQSFVDAATGPTRFALALISVFAAIAALLAAVGLYGVLSTSVSQRTAEIGVRMVFGAPKNSIFQLVIGQGLRLTAIGIAAGLLGAFAVTRVMQSMLVGVAPTDIPTFATIAVIFLIIASLACWLPALRASSLDPADAIREE
jgi:predicted permease